MMILEMAGPAELLPSGAPARRVREVAREAEPRLPVQSMVGWLPGHGNYHLFHGPSDLEYAKV